MVKEPEVIDISDPIEAAALLGGSRDAWNVLLARSRSPVVFVRMPMYPETIEGTVGFVDADAK